MRTIGPRDEGDGGTAPTEALARALSGLRLPAARMARAAFPLMLPSLVSDVPDNPGWLFEIKWDGVRVLAMRTAGRVRLWSRTGIDITARYPEVAAAVTELAEGDLVLDGEIVALDGEGRPRFELLQRRMHATRAITAVPITAYVYDLLALAGHDVRGLALSDRKALLARVVPRTGTLRYCDHVNGDGKKFLAAACDAGLEGVVAKRVDSPYRGGRSADWRKIKCHCRQEFVVGGYTAPKGTRAHIGALHLGVYDGGALVYVGRVGSGLTDAVLDLLAHRIRDLAVERSPFTRGNPPQGAAHSWVRPELVCGVRFAAWTRDGRLRHPVFLGFRSDRSTATVRGEKATPARAGRGRRARQGGSKVGSDPPRGR